MARKNSIKTNVENGYYHIYNRGVEKRSIFEDSQDVKVFLNYLKEYLSPPQDNKKLIKSLTFKDRVFKGVPRRPINFCNKIELIAYCLMPNHFHFLIKQLEKSAMRQFMHSLILRYAMYFNKKYERVGPLFQGRYKAVLVTSEPYLLHLSRYIHLNPREYTSDLKKAYSSYADYLGIRKTSWVKPEMILSYFNNATLPELKKINKYDKFVENNKKDSKKFLGKLTLD